MSSIGAGDFVAADCVAGEAVKVTPPKVDTGCGVYGLMFPPLPAAGVTVKIAGALEPIDAWLIASRMLGVCKSQS